VHREERIPSADGLSDAHLVQVHLRAAQALVVLEAHAPLPHHDDDVAPKDVRALQLHGNSLSLCVIRLGNYMASNKNMARALRGASTCEKLTLCVPTEL